MNAADYMSDVVEMVRLEAEEKQIAFSYERLTDFSEGYHLDGVRLQQVLLNLLHNAIKFTPAGGTIQMTAGALEQNDTYTTLQFTVKDTGIGMSREFMEHSLYQSFAQENQDMERKLLLRMKCEVDIADDGKVGYEMFQKSEKGYYNMVLMDIRMPEMDGLETTRAIRSIDREDARSVPILAVSANAFEEYVRKSLDSGMNEHLSKPVDAKILYEKIKNKKIL